MKLAVMETHEKEGAALKPCSMRQLTSEMSHLSQPDGAAQFNQGNTSVLSAIYGPAEVKINKEIVDRATIELIYKPKVGLPSCKDRAMEKILRNTFDTAILSKMHPRTLISIILQEMQNDGSLLACCINSVCLALLDSAMSMKYQIASVSCALDESGEIVLDPNTKQEESALATLTFAFDSMNLNIITCETSGNFQNTQYTECLLKCREAAKEIFKFYRDSMKRKLLNEH